MPHLLEEHLVEEEESYYVLGLFLLGISLWLLGNWALLLAIQTVLLRLGSNLEPVWMYTLLVFAVRNRGPCCDLYRFLSNKLHSHLE